MKVGTAMIAAQPEIWRTTSFWRTLSSARLASRIEVSSSRCDMTLLVDAARVIGDVAEEALQLRVISGKAPRSSASSGREQRSDGAMELDHLALEEVDALGRVAALAKMSSSTSSRSFSSPSTTGS